MERNLVSLFYQVLSLLKNPPTSQQQERLSFSIKHYLEWIEKEHPLLRGELLQMGLSADGAVSLYLTDKGLGYVERNYQELRDAARYKLGVTRFHATSGSPCGGGRTIGDEIEIPEADMHYEQEDPIDFLLEELKSILEETDPEKREEEESVSLRELGKLLNQELLDVPIPLPFVRGLVQILYQQICTGMADDEVENVLQNLLTFRENARLKPRPNLPDTLPGQ